MVKRKTRKKTPKKKVKVEKEDDEVTYIRLENPLPLRRDILETAIDSAEILQDWENYKNLRVKKIEVYKKLVFVMQKIEKEVSILKKNLPKKSNVKGLEKEHIVKEKKVIKQEPGETEKKEFNTELDREISGIRSKLDNLKL